MRSPLGSVAPRARAALWLAAGALALSGCAALGWRGAADASHAGRRPAERDGGSRADPSLAEELRRADRFREAGDRDRALLGYLEAYRLAPDDSSPRVRIGYLHLAEDPERAASIFAGVIEDDPDAGAAHAGLGLAELGMGRLEQARLALERAVELAPDSARAVGALAVVYELLGRRPAALELGERARELAPKDARLVNNVGVSHLVAGDWAGAEHAFRTAVLLDPRDLALRNNLGLALGRQGRYEQALEEFREAGTEQAAENNLGYVYFLNGRYTEAIAHYERALAAPGPDGRKVLENLNAALDALEASRSR
jgi:Flp pilus assembly protein TadD